MPDPTRPASISAVSTGPSSLIIDALINRPDERSRAELIERHARLQGQHRAREESGQQHHRQRAETNDVDLLNQVAEIERTAEGAARRGDAELDVLLHLEQALLDRFDRAILVSSVRSSQRGRPEAEIARSQRANLVAE